MRCVTPFVLLSLVLTLVGCSEKSSGPRYEDRSLRRVAILDFTDNSRSVDAGSQLKHLMQREMFYRGMRMVDDRVVDERWETVIPLIEKEDYAGAAKALEADMLILGQVDEFGYAKELGVRPSLVWRYTAFWGRDYPTVWTLPASQQVHAASEGYMIDLAHRAVRMGVNTLFDEIKRNPAFLIHHVPSDFIDQAFATRITEVPNLIVARPDPVLIGQGGKNESDASLHDLEDKHRPVLEPVDTTLASANVTPRASEPASPESPVSPSTRSTSPPSIAPTPSVGQTTPADISSTPTPSSVTSPAPASVQPPTAQPNRTKTTKVATETKSKAPTRREVQTTANGTVAREYLKDGSLEREIPYDAQQRIHGTVVMYYDSGQVFAKMAYVQNRRHGESLYYYESGELRTKMTFEHGAPVSSTSYFESGKVKAVRSFKPQR